MKSSERHKLKTNELERMVESAKPFLEEHLLKFIIGAAVLFILIAGVVYFKYKDPANSQEWSNFYNVLHDESATANNNYSDIAEQFPNTTVGMWAELKQADKEFNSALRLMFTEREQAISGIKRAGTAYHKLIENANSSADIQERAAYGLARVAEAKCNGETSIPIKQYDDFVKSYPQSVFVASAKKRIEALNKDEAKEFYAWFSQENPALSKQKGFSDSTGHPGSSMIPPGGSLVPEKFRLDLKDRMKPGDKKEDPPSKTEPFPKDNPTKKEDTKPAKAEPFPTEKKKSDKKQTENKTTDNKKSDTEKTKPQTKTEKKPKGPALKAPEKNKTEKKETK